MLHRLGHLYAYAFGWPALARMHKGLFYLSGRCLGMLNYTSDKISGEGLTIDHCLRGRTSPVVFDVGANEGEWLAAVLRRCPGAIVHAFEPQQALAAKIAAAHPRLRVNNQALGDRAGDLSLFDYADHPGSQHASLLPGVIETVHGAAPRRTTVSVVTLDDYCGQHRIDRIDLLKIDVEGFELNVLRGAKRLLDGGSIDAIQFEFNEMNVVGHSFLNDFMTLLDSTHVLYRVLPHGLLPLRPNEHWLNEQFVYQNIVALKR
jgi:FkbM family methyltransferase